MAYGGEFVSKAQIAQRVEHLLLQFPDAASTGVRWSVLMGKYEEVYGRPLDIVALGHARPLAASTALLFDVLRLVNGQDEDDPVVAVEDGVALSAAPGCMGTWPSIYRALCRLAAERGALKDTEVTHPLLVSRLAPQLQRAWHADFEEATVSYLSEEGAAEVGDTLGLVQCLLQWREQRLQWRAAEGRRPSAVDRAIEPRLEIVDGQAGLELRLADDVADLPRFNAKSPDMTMAMLMSVQELSLSQSSCAGTAKASMFKDAGTDTKLDDESVPLELPPPTAAEQAEGVVSKASSTREPSQGPSVRRTPPPSTRAEPRREGTPKEAKPRDPRIPPGIVERLRAQIEAKARQ